MSTSVINSVMVMQPYIVIQILSHPTSFEIQYLLDSNKQSWIVKETFKMQNCFKNCLLTINLNLFAVSQTPSTDCFTLTGSSEGNLKQHTAVQKLFLCNEWITKIKLLLFKNYEL